MELTPLCSPLLFEGLTNHLRRLGFSVGVDHHLRLQLLLSRICGECSPEDLKSLICPVFAVNEEQQEAFYSAFDSFLPLLSAHTQAPAAAEALPGQRHREGAAPPRLTPAKWAYFLAAVAVLALLIGIAEWKSHIGSTPANPTAQVDIPTPPVAPSPSPEVAPPETGAAPPAPAPSTNFQPQGAGQPPARPSVFERIQPLVARFPFDVATVIVIFGPILFWVAYEFYRLSQRRLMLQKQAGKKPPHSWPIRVKGRGASVYDSSQLTAAARRLHSRQAAESYHLDVRGTVQATTGSLGYPFLQYRPDTRFSEYLVLIDRVSAHDHQAALFTQLADALHGQGLYLQQYFFDGDPRICWSPEASTPVRLSDLQSKYGEHRLLMIGDADRLTDPVTGRLEGWAHAFSTWADRAILTPLPVSSWGARERALAGQFMMLPATTEALFSVVGYFGGSDPGETRSGAIPVAGEGGSDTPPAEVVERLRSALEPGVFSWLCSSAIYPELHWDLTLYLASLPCMPEDLVTEANLLRLIRLPWFRTGVIPDEIRYELIRQLNSEQERAVRQAIVEVLEQNPADEDTFAFETQALEIAVNRDLLSRSKKRGGATRELLRHRSTNDNVGDHVVLRSLESVQSSPLDFLLPRQLRHIFYERGLSVLGLRTAVRFAVTVGVVVIGLAFFVSWWNNRDLLSEVERAARSQTNRQGRATSLQDLQALEALRFQVARVEGGLPWRFHWGLYSGDRILPQARTAYFRQFHRLLLIDLNSQMVAELEGLPANPDASAPYDPAYNNLKAHLTITSGSCAVESPFLSRQLKEVRARIAPSAGSDWQALADRQIDFYASELARGNPLRLAEDIEGRERARQYLGQVRGIDRLYATILANAEKSLGKGSRLSALAANYAQVLHGPDEISSAFSAAGWAYLEKASKEGNAAASGDACVLGGASGMVANYKQNTENSQAIQRKFLREYVDRWRKFVEGFSVTRYANAGDAARRLEILADRKSPLLAVFAMTANATNYPAPAAQKDAGLVEKGISKAAAILKKAETGAKAVTNPPAAAPDSLNSPADIPRFFQPVHVVEPPGSVTWVVEKNAAYIDALAQLRSSMQDIAQKGSDPVVHQTAGLNYDKATDAARQIARGFNNVGVGSLDTTVEKLLLEPIRLTSPFIIKDIDGDRVKKMNGELRTFCGSQGNTLRKYPFRTSSTDDASLEEFAAIFQPVTGAIWKFQQQSLAELTVKEGSQWKPKDPAKKPLATQGMLDFLNRAQSIADVFYPGGATQAQLTYTLRPKLDSSLKEFTLELEVDGRPYQWTTGLQHPFNWPTKNVGAVARLRTSANVGIPIASRGGIWGVFRILGDAEPRELNAKVVEWKYTSSGAGRREPIEPAVQLEIVGFPGGQDVFNPKFWEGLRCPSAAVQ